MKLLQDLRFADNSIQQIAAILYQSIAYAASITPNAALGRVVVVGTLTGNLTVNAPTSPVTGQRLLLLFKQDGTGGRVVSYNAVFSGTPAPASLVAGATFYSEWVYNGTNWISTYIPGPAPSTITPLQSQATGLPGTALPYSREDHVHVNPAAFANYVLAGPTSGGTAAMTTRFLVPSDIPAATTAAQGAAILATPSSDVTAGHVVQASDARLSDARTPAAASITAKTQFGSGMEATQKGTSNPGSPATGDSNLRTDIIRDTYYNGTYWVTKAVLILPFDNTAAFAGVTATASNVGRLNHNGDLDWLLYRFSASVYINATNSGAAFWTLQLRYITAGNTITNVATLSTSSLSPNVWSRLATATFSPATAATSVFMFEILANTTGAPGALTVVPQLMVREIIP
jgi:hypothetical protein